MYFPQIPCQKIQVYTRFQLNCNNFVKSHLHFRFLQAVRGVGPPGAPSPALL